MVELVHVGLQTGGDDGFDTQFSFLALSRYAIDVSPMISTRNGYYVSKPYCSGVSIRSGKFAAIFDGPAQIDGSFYIIRTHSSSHKKDGIAYRNGTCR